MAKRKAEVIDLLDDDSLCDTEGVNDDPPEPSVAIKPEAQDGGARCQGVAVGGQDVSVNGAGEVKEGANVAEAMVSNEDEGDDDSVASMTKDQYKEICTNLTLKLEKKKEVQGENRRLKREVKELKDEVKRLRILLGGAGEVHA